MLSRTVASGRLCLIVKAFEVAEHYKTDPGASPTGRFVTIDQTILSAGDYAKNIRILVIGNVETCPAPIPDFYPSYPDPTHPLAHKWTVPSSGFVGLGEDLMGGMVGGFSASCWFYGTEIASTQKVPVGLVLSAYGGSSLESWMDTDA